MDQAQLTRLEGPSVELDIVRHLLVQGAKAAPLLVVAAALVWGVDGALSAAYGLALVGANYLLSAALLSTTARISLGLMMGAALFGYLMRLGLIFLAVWLVKDASWVNVVPLGITLIITHLGLLLWELRYISGSLAYPGLKPVPTKES